MPLSHRPGNCIAKRCQKHVTSLVSDQITVLCCVGADGNSIPPFMLYDRKNLNRELTLGDSWHDVQVEQREWLDGYWTFPRLVSTPLLTVCSRWTLYTLSARCCTASIRKWCHLVFPPPAHDTHRTAPGCGLVSIHWRPSGIMNARGFKPRASCVSVPVLTALCSRIMTKENVRSGFKKLVYSHWTGML